MHQHFDWVSHKAIADDPLVITSLDKGKSDQQLRQWHVIGNAISFNHDVLDGEIGRSASVTLTLSRMLQAPEPKDSIMTIDWKGL